MELWSATLAPFLSKVWDGEMVVYDRRSGNTHALDRLATALLEALIAAPNEISVAELRDCVATELEEDEKAEPLAVVGSALDFLQNLGLVTHTHI